MQLHARAGEEGPQGGGAPPLQVQQAAARHLEVPRRLGRGGDLHVENNVRAWFPQLNLKLLIETGSIDNDLVLVGVGVALFLVAVADFQVGVAVSQVGVAAFQVGVVANTTGNELT